MTWVSVYLFNLMLTVVGHVLVAIGKAAWSAGTTVITGGNGVLGMRTHHLIFFGMLATSWRPSSHMMRFLYLRGVQLARLRCAASLTVRSLPLWWYLQY